MIMSKEKSASEWYVRLNFGESDNKLRQEFDDWLIKSDANKSAYKECEATMSLLSGLESAPEVTEYVAQCKADINNKYQPVYNVLQVDPSSWMSIKKALFAVIGKTTDLLTLKSGAPVIASVSAMSVFCVVLLLQSNSLPAKEYYQTAVGEQQTVELLDGSQMMLNTATQLHVEYGQHQRRLEMQSGEAFFSVKPDPGRPFDVAAGKIIVRAVGTRFNVLLQNDIMTVSVLEGSVRVLDQNSVTLSSVPSGYTVSYKVADATAVSTQRLVDSGRIDAWLRGQLEFDHWRLDAAIAEHNRYAQKKIMLKDEALGSMEITGVFQIGDTESLSAALQAMLPLKLSEHQNTIVLVSDSDR